MTQLPTLQTLPFPLRHIVWYDIYIHFILKVIKHRRYDGPLILSLTIMHGRPKFYIYLEWNTVEFILKPSSGLAKSELSLLSSPMGGLTFRPIEVSDHFGQFPALGGFCPCLNISGINERMIFRKDDLYVFFFNGFVQERRRVYRVSPVYRLSPVLLLVLLNQISCKKGHK